MFRALMSSNCNASYVVYIDWSVLHLDFDSLHNNIHNLPLDGSKIHLMSFMPITDVLSEADTPPDSVRSEIWVISTPKDQPW